MFLGLVVVLGLTFTQVNLSAGGINRRNLTPKRVMYDFDLANVAGQSRQLLVYFRLFLTRTFFF